MHTLLLNVKPGPYLKEFDSLHWGFWILSSRGTAITSADVKEAYCTITDKQAASICIIKRFCVHILKTDWESNVDQRYRCSLMYAEVHTVLAVGELKGLQAGNEYCGIVWERSFAVWRGMGNSVGDCMHTSGCWSIPFLFPLCWLFCALFFEGVNTFGAGLAWGSARPCLLFATASFALKTRQRNEPS